MLIFVTIKGVPLIFNPKIENLKMKGKRQYVLFFILWPKFKIVKDKFELRRWVVFRVSLPETQEVADFNKFVEHMQEEARELGYHLGSPRIYEIELDDLGNLEKWKDLIKVKGNGNRYDKLKLKKL